jgi:hypothetical protein
MQKLKSGEISALVRVIGKPIDVFEKIPANSGLHFVPIPFSKTFADYYTVGELTRQDYPTLVGEGERVDTIAVPAVLAAFNWQKGTDRYQRVQRFVQALFTHWDKFRQPPRHPKWRDVNLAATVPGWTRLGAASEMLDQLAAQAEPAATTNAQASSSEFASFLAANGGTNLSVQQREALFRQFEQWQRQRQAQPAR